MLIAGNFNARQPARAQALPVDASAASDWSMFQHDAAHSGATSATALTNQPLYLQWAYAFGERVEVEAQPVISAGVIYQGVMNGQMVALDAASGKVRWIQQPGGPVAHTAAVADTAAGKLVFFGSLDGSVYALSAATGETVWRFVTGGPVVSAPAVAHFAGGSPQDILYIGSNDGGLYALDAASGAQAWKIQTGGPVASSPAVSGGQVYFGSEDMQARAAGGQNGQLLWSRPLGGAGMTNTYPVVSPDGKVVIFVTKKPGAGSYVPLEGYPNAAASANPVSTWNSYYQAHPTARNLYYLDAASGADRWNPGAQTFSPLPLPYWGLIHPIIGPDGAAYFPAPAGTSGFSQTLDHDNRLFRVDLVTGVTAPVAGGALPEFQARSDEVGRHAFAGGDYLYTISEDLGAFHYSGDKKVRVLFSNGDASGYNFGSHMDPLSPLPTRHLWRYGGAIAMGGAAAASPPVVYNGQVYYTSYGWIYALGPANRNLNPATSFPRRDARLYANSTITYPRGSALSMAQVRAEIEWRVDAIVARGAGNIPITARWEQPGGPMMNNETPFEVYGMPHELVRVLSAAYPWLPAEKQAGLRAYLASLTAATLLNPGFYAYETRCIIYGESGIKTGTDACSSAGGKIVASWLANNPNITAQNLYALSVYAAKTGEWSSIQGKWALIKEQFRVFTGAYRADLGFAFFEQWRVGRLNLPAQIAMAQGVRDMAAHLNDSATRAQAQTLLDNLLNTRVKLAGFVPSLYDSGARKPAAIRLNPDGTIVNADIMGSSSPYNNQLIPFDAAVRDRDSDPSQVNWLDDAGYRVDAGTGFMHYPALSGAFPMSSELAGRLRAALLEKTRAYVKSYEVNAPWWWMTDQAHHTTGSGEHLYHSPTLAWSLFQVKARVLDERWGVLSSQLPEPASFNSRYDPYRLENLATLLERHAPNLIGSRIAAANSAPRGGEDVQFTVCLQNSGAAFEDPLELRIAIPSGLSYNAGSMTASLGHSDDSDPGSPAWTGIMGAAALVTIEFSARVASNETAPYTVAASLNSAATGALDFRLMVIANASTLFLPGVIR